LKQSVVTEKFCRQKERVTSYLLCGRENISDTTLLAGDIIIQCLVFLQLDSNDTWVRAGTLCITDLAFHFTEPLEKLINVSNNLQRTLVEIINYY
jgi:hypothetical protein